MPRKRSAIGVRTPPARRMAARAARGQSSRTLENPQQSQARLQSDRLRHRVQRASETPQQSQTRQEADRLRHFRQRASTWADMLNAAFHYNTALNYEQVTFLQIGHMDKQWKVRIPDLPEPPEALRTLLDGSSPHSAEFMQRVRHYNNDFQMTYFGCGSRVVLPGYMPTFKVQGQVYHRIGSVLPPLNSDSRQLQPAFLQVFFIGDSSAEVATRHRNFPITKPQIVSILQDMLHRHNPYVHLFKASIEKMPSPDYKLVIKADKAPPGHHPRTFNAPTINEVAIVIVQENCDRREIVLSKRGSGVQRINEFHRSYDALQYPLVFWNGQDGYHFHIPQLIDGVPSAHKTVSCMDLYASLLMIRSRNPGITNWLLAFGDLTHQILVHIYAKVESERLHYISAHQAQLRATEYINLLDAIRTDRSHALIGRQVILPSSIVVSPRHMHEYAQDCMAYVRKYGRPDLFITFTCNPDWPEIKLMQFSTQGAFVRHDLVARIFQLKVTKLIDLITKGDVFGKPQCWCYTIEWQKRGLPHAHILLWLKEKIRPNQIDSIICAEIPNEEVDASLFRTVTKNTLRDIENGTPRNSHRKRRQFKQTDAFTRDMVIGLKRAGWSIRHIAADTHLGASTVHRLWRRWLEQGNVAIYRNVGATRVTSARVDRRILRQAVAALQATCTAILQHVQDTLDHSISTRTISRRLVANGLHSCRPLRRLPLTPPNRRQRLEWCRARSTWMTEWHRVVFSDESRFCLSSDSRRIRVWRRRGERSNPAAIVERPTVRQRGIMVWGAIAYDSRSPLLRIQGTMTAQRYVDDLLRPVTLPYLQGVPNALYQQDNARPHTARISQQALQDVQMLPWPPYSPDLSPIEHVWDIIGRRLHALPQPRSEDELWQMVERERRAIPQDAIRTLIDSLPRRVAACIAVRVRDGYPLYRRRRPEEGGFSFVKRVRVFTIENGDQVVRMTNVTIDNRVYTVHPNFEECFYPRLLLHSVRGPTSFAAPRTINGVLCQTYKEACLHLGLLEKDQQWHHCFQEAVLSESPLKIREPFAIILTCCHPTNPQDIWAQFKEPMSADILNLARQQTNDGLLQLTYEMSNQALILLEQKVLQVTGFHLTKFGMRSPQRNVTHRTSHELLRETSYDLSRLLQFVASNEPKLANVPEQKEAYERILSKIDSNAGGLYFLDAPGGTGKTFLINLLLTKVLSTGDIALSTASSGIAANLLHGGRTAHSTSKLPLDLTRDEDQRPMGGVVLLLAGDFRQILHIIPRGTIADELHACLKASPLWSFVERLTLSTNMRAVNSGDPNSLLLSQFLLQLGSDQLNDTDGNVNFLNELVNTVVCDSLSGLKNSVFPNIGEMFNRGRANYYPWLCERAILDPRNCVVDAINAQLFKEIPGQSILYTSVDSTIDAEDCVEYTTEFLNSLEPSGMPPHHLELRVGVPIILLRNIDAPRLCNGTRLCVKRLWPHVVEATILTGCFQNEEVFIPRIPLIHEDKHSSLHFKRLQFPIRVSFAMSINKAQGQSLKMAGIDLEQPSFSHGQLYVAGSRVGSGRNLYVLAPENKTSNFVYSSVLS
ncbi:hypothetical protein LAZ67_3004489 [Cordylochernes scorpioides]|uniref:ATP-dependent DNA helicase n=1 Tax=Cordylochernes scorpioides TaxID=51811 RepID=A0ABY6K9E1_9ARAC|nr:hypothetical protein LAZ67_3004489 [Cordylochernes scorpioides]